MAGSDSDAWSSPATAESGDEDAAWSSAPSQPSDDDGGALTTAPRPRRGRRPGQVGSQALRAALREERVVEQQAEQQLVAVVPAAEAEAPEARGRAHNAAKARAALAARRQRTRDVALPAQLDPATRQFGALLARLQGNRPATDLTGRILVAATQPAAQVFQKLRIRVDKASAHLWQQTRMLASTSAEARAAGVPRRKWMPALFTMAAATYHASRSCAAALFTWLSRSVRLKKFEAVALLTTVLSDSTLFDLGIKDSRARQQKKRKGVRATDPPVKQRGKVLQSEMKVGVLVKHRVAKQYQWLTVQIATPLQCGDRTTADVLRACWHDLSRLPELAALAAQCRCSATINTWDRDAANLRLHRALETEVKCIEQLPCDVHKIAQSLSLGYNLASADISGLVAFGLSMRAAGSLESIRTALKSVLRQRLRICRAAAPPLASSGAAQYARQLWDLTLPPTGPDGASNAERRATLERPYPSLAVPEFFCMRT